MTMWEAGMSVTADRLGGTQSGIATVDFNASTFGTEAVTFPEAFTATPHVSATIVSGSGSMIGATIFVTVLSATGMTIRVDATSAVTGAFNVHWIAIAP